jgi:hypothetical protein
MQKEKNVNSQKNGQILLLGLPDSLLMLNLCASLNHRNHPILSGNDLNMTFVMMGVPKLFIHIVFVFFSRIFIVFFLGQPSKRCFRPQRNLHTQLSGSFYCVWKHVFVFNHHNDMHNTHIMYFFFDQVVVGGDG